MNRTATFALVFVALFGLLGADTSSCGGAFTDPGAGGATDGEAAFAGIDPQVLNNEVLKSSALASYLMGDIDSAPGVDANTDEATLEALAAQDGPMAETAVNDWLATLDPSVIPTAGTQPRSECINLGCPYSRKCMNAPYNTIPGHICWVTGCGDAKCSICPDYFPELLKHIVLKSWCSYTCTDGKFPETVVAIGMTAVRNDKGDLYPTNGAWCLAP